MPLSGAATCASLGSVEILFAILVGGALLILVVAVAMSRADGVITGKGDLRDADAHARAESTGDESQR